MNIAVTLHLWPLTTWLRWRYERTVMDRILYLGPISIAAISPY